MKKVVRDDIPWNKVKKEYLEGVTPKALATKYKTTSKKIRDKASKEDWVDDKTAISDNVLLRVEDRITGLTNLALDTLEDVIKAPETEKNIKVQACRAILDISGLKSSKQEINGNVGIQKVFITPDEVKETDEHIDNVLNEQWIFG